MRTVPLRYLAEINTRVLPETTAPDRTFKYIDISQVDSNGVLSLPDEGVSFGEAPSRARRLASAGDTVVSTVRTYLTAIARVPATSAPLVFSTGFAVLEPMGVESRFLTYACRSQPFVGEVVARSTGVSYPAINPSDLASIPIPMPEPQEQRRIADFLDDRITRIDQIISARLHHVGRLEELVLGMVRSDLNGVGTIPLRRVLRSVRTGGTPPQEADDECGLPWYTPGDFLNSLRVGDPTRTIGADAATIFPARSVLIVGIGATTGKVAWLDHNASGNQQITCVVPNDELLDGRFLLHELASRATELRATAPSATLPIINNEVLKSLRISYPPLDEQRRLAKWWDQAMQQTLSISSMIRRTIALLEEYKQSLITAAVTGELDVTTASSGIPG